jgi:hypothetical protein
MKDSFYADAIQDKDKALARFNATSQTGHHSISDHIKIEILFENISKALAIVLNSLQDYATSEKSGRYTEMQGSTEQEVKLYNKWKDIFRSKILEEYPETDDSMLEQKIKAWVNKDESLKSYIDRLSIKDGKLEDTNIDIKISKQLETIKNTNKTLPSVKLAQENARYVLSVFTRSTTMGYTTSLRQWNYIYDWCMKYLDVYFYRENKLWLKEENRQASYFEEQLFLDLQDLAEFLYNNIYIEQLRDTKNRCFDFLTTLSGEYYHPMSYYTPADDVIADSYQVSYYGSFVQIAQAERHRTLKYFIKYDEDLQMYYTPEIIKGTKYEEEWLNDLKSISYLVPQATQVLIIETGHISDFVLKCEERLCKRAQLEVMKQTKATAERFYNNSDNLSSAGKVYMSKFVDRNGNIQTKCQMLGTCHEPCNKVTDALSRRI